MTTKTPMSKLFLADFVSIQRNSFFNLVETGLIEDFQKRNPITNIRKDLELYFYPEYYRLTLPNISIQEAIVKTKSYSSKIYIPVQFTDKKNRQMIVKWVLVGHLPLMTKRGHFVLNGVARIVVNQILRSPGIYFHEKIYEIYSNKWSEKPVEVFKRYYADLICLKGAWLRLELDKEKAIWAQMKKGPKLPLLWLLIGMGLSEKTIFLTLPNPNYLLLNFKEDDDGNVKYDYVQYPYQAWEKLYFLNTSKYVDKQKASNLGRKWLFKKFMNPRTYDIGKQGRISFNKKLGLNFSLTQTTLTGQDLLFATESLMKLEKGLKKTDDIDHLKNRRVRTSGELIQIQIGIGLIRLEKMIREKINKVNPRFNRQIYSPFKQNMTRISTNAAQIRPWLIQINNLRDEQQTEIVKTEAKQKSVKISLALHALSDKSQHYQQERIVTSLSNLPEKMVRFHYVSHFSRSDASEASDASNANIASGATKNEHVKENGLGDNSSKQNTNKKTSQKDEKKSSLVQKKRKIFKEEKIISKTSTKLMAKIPLNYLINTKAFNGALKEFFGSSQLSQYMDQINPLAELTHKRRLTSLGPGGVNRDTATLAIRGIHPTHYGRICPIETPEGKNTGLVNSMTTYAKITDSGLLLTPFYKVYKGQVQKYLGMFFLSAEQEEKMTIASADLNRSKINFLPKFLVPVRRTDEFTKVLRNQIDYIGVSPIQMISIATSLIPFLEHDDANRALMGSNMQRQAVPVIRPDRPIVGTGLEARAASDSGHPLQSNHSGFVGYASGKKIIIYTFE